MDQSCQSIQSTQPGVELDALALDGNRVAGLRPSTAPEDPCLEPLYQDWHELSVDARDQRPGQGFISFRITLDRSNFTLTLEGSRRDGTSETLYQSGCGLGDVDTPTPDGRFIINHVYCYPDVVFFGTSGDRVPGLYNGFLAPLLICDEEGKCRPYRELGIHGFDPTAYPEPQAIRHETCGAVSSGCIRVPDPCTLKRTLVRLVGIGPLKRNDRGSYHWLDRPVEVRIIGDYPGTGDSVTLASILEQSLQQMQNGLKSLLGVFGP